MLELAPERTDPRGGKNVDVAAAGERSLLPGKHAWPYTGPRPPGWLVPPARFELTHPAPEAGALSPELRGRPNSAYAGGCRLMPRVQAP